MIKSTTFQMVIATIGGLIFGTIFGTTAIHLKFIGDIFIRLIQMSIVALVMTSVISAIGEMGLKKNSDSSMKMGLHTFKWILIFTSAAAIVGVVLSILIQPGAGLTIDGMVPNESVEIINFQDTMVSFVSTNIFESMGKADMIPIVIFSIFFGTGLTIHIRNTGGTLLLDITKELNQIILTIIQLSMKVAPIGVFFLLANVIGTTGWLVIIPMLKYLGTLFLGVTIMMFFMTFIVTIRCRLNPLLLPKKFLQMSLVAITTTSSAITFPTSLKDSIEKFGIHRDVANFTMSIGLTMGSSGAAMCYVIMIFFMQQSSGIELSPFKLLFGVIISVMLTFGSITVPGGAAVIATFLATTLGFPLEAVALLIGVDWFAGMFRTFLNVNNDIFTSLLVAHTVGALDHDIFNNNDFVSIKKNKP